MKIHPVEPELFLADEQTGMAKQIAAFRKFSNAPNSTNTIITKNCALLRYYTANSGNFLPTFRGQPVGPILTVQKWGVPLLAV